MDINPHGLKTLLFGEILDKFFLQAQGVAGSGEVRGLPDIGQLYPQLAARLQFGQVTFFLKGYVLWRRSTS